MSNRSYQKSVSVPDMLARIIAAATAGKADEAKSLSNMVALQSAKSKAFGKSALPDVAYDPRSSVVREEFEQMDDPEVAASCLTHGNDEDYGPPTSNEHKLVEWFEREITGAHSKGLPPVVAARRCAARVLDKNAKRWSTFRRDAIFGLNELLLRLNLKTTELLSLAQQYMSVTTPSDQEPETDTNSTRATAPTPSNATEIEIEAPVEELAAPVPVAESAQFGTHIETDESNIVTNGAETEAEAATDGANTNADAPIDTEMPTVNETGIPSDMGEVEPHTESPVDTNSETETY